MWWRDSDWECLRVVPSTCSGPQAACQWQTLAGPAEARPGVDPRRPGGAAAVTLKLRSCQLSATTRTRLGDPRLRCRVGRRLALPSGSCRGPSGPGRGPTGSGGPNHQSESRGVVLPNPNLKGSYGSRASGTQHFLLLRQTGCPFWLQRYPPASAALHESPSHRSESPSSRAAGVSGRLIHSSYTVTAGRRHVPRGPGRAWATSGE